MNWIGGVFTTVSLMCVFLWQSRCLITQNANILNTEKQICQINDYLIFEEPQTSHSLVSNTYICLLSFVKHMHLFDYVTELLACHLSIRWLTLLSPLSHLWMARVDPSRLITQFLKLSEFLDRKVINSNHFNKIIYNFWILLKTFFFFLIESTSFH